VLPIVQKVIFATVRQANYMLLGVLIGRRGYYPANCGSVATICGSEGLSRLVKRLASCESVKLLLVNLPTGSQALIPTNYRAITWGSNLSFQPSIGVGDCHVRTPVLRIFSRETKFSPIGMGMYVS